MEFKNQKEMFEWIWENRPNVSELSGKPLLNKNDNRWHYQFLHVLSKGSYPRYKFNPDNIILALPEEHAIQERFEYFMQKKDELRLKYYEGR